MKIALYHCISRGASPPAIRFQKHDKIMTMTIAWQWQNHDKSTNLRNHDKIMTKFLSWFCHVFVEYGNLKKNMIKSWQIFCYVFKGRIGAHLVKISTTRGRSSDRHSPPLFLLVYHRVKISTTRGRSSDRHSPPLLM